MGAVFFAKIIDHMVNEEYYKGTLTIWSMVFARFFERVNSSVMTAVNESR